MLEHSQALKVIYEKRLALQQIWVKTSSNGHDMLAAIKRLGTRSRSQWDSIPA